MRLHVGHIDTASCSGPRRSEFTRSPSNFAKVERFAGEHFRDDFPLRSGCVHHRAKPADVCSQNSYNRSTFENSSPLVRGANPVELLFGSYRRHILGLLLMRDEALHVREIARLTGVPAGSLHRELRSLADAGLLLRIKNGNQVQYRANKEHPIYPELAGIFRKTVGLADMIRDALTPVSERIDAAFIFGSVARGEETATSDVDVFILGDLPFVDSVGALAPFQERLGRHINSVLMRRTDLRKKRRERDNFVERVMKEPKLFVIGGADDLGKSSQDRAAQRA
jgi:predicted nucleotidyltransferase